MLQLVPLGDSIPCYVIGYDDHACVFNDAKLAS